MGSKTREEKFFKIHKDFELYEVFMYILNIYYSQKELKHFGLEILAVFGTLGHFLKPCDLEMVQIYNKEYH